MRPLWYTDLSKLCSVFCLLTSSCFPMASNNRLMYRVTIIQTYISSLTYYVRHLSTCLSQRALITKELFDELLPGCGYFLEFNYVDSLLLDQHCLNWLIFLILLAIYYFILFLSAFMWFCLSGLYTYTPAYLLIIYAVLIGRIFDLSYVYTAIWLSHALLATRGHPFWFLYLPHFFGVSHSHINIHYIDQILSTGSTNTPVFFLFNKIQVILKRAAHPEFAMYAVWVHQS